LVFFYDGVPPLETEMGAPTAESQDSVPPPTGEVDGRLERLKSASKFYNHPRYWENSCGSCHESGGRLLKTVRHGLCVTCHFVKPEDKKKYMHGPVAVNGCLACHRYHRSKYPKILLTDAQTLCANCHEPGTLTQDKHHKEMETKRCVDCHDPHGGNDRFYLLPGVVTDNSSGNAPIIEPEP